MLLPQAIIAKSKNKGEFSLGKVTVVGWELSSQFYHLILQVLMEHQRDLLLTLMHMGRFLLGFSTQGQKYAA